MHDDHNDENKTFFIDTKFNVRRQKKLHVENLENRLNLALISFFQN